MRTAFCSTTSERLCGTCLRSDVFMRSLISVSLHMWFCCRQEWSPNSSETLIVFNGVVLMKAGRLRVPQRRYVRAMDVEVARKGRSVEGRIAWRAV